MEIITLDQIKTCLPRIDVIAAMEEGFAAYSRGDAVVPPVGELLLDRGDVHIKYGFIKGEEFYVIKVASGFYGNSKLGLPSSNGLMLLFKQETGELACVLLDEGHLTDVRTAAAGAVTAKYLAPKNVQRIGILGTGIQARLQLEYLRTVVSCRDVLAFGRGESQLSKYAEDVSKLGFQVDTTEDAADLLRTCNLIVTTTPTESPLLNAGELRPGTHITAVGSDTAMTQELDTSILKSADLVVADSIPQCLERGEIHKALEAGAIIENELVELGNIVSGKASGRTGDDQITVADLTGVAVQDIKIADAVYVSAVGT